MGKCYLDTLNRCFEKLEELIKSGNLKEELIKGNKEIDIVYFKKMVKIDMNSKKFIGIDDKKEQIIIIHYLCNFSDKKNEELITFKNLPEGSFYFPSIYSRIYLPIIEKYGSIPSKFLEKSIKASAEKISDFSVKFNVFSNVFYIFELIPEDEEFPADLKILFNKTASEIFEIEDLAIIGEIIVSKIT